MPEERGWYPDQEKPDKLLRFWDGMAWTGLTVKHNPKKPVVFEVTEMRYARLSNKRDLHKYNQLLAQGWDMYATTQHWDTQTYVFRRPKK